MPQTGVIREGKNINLRDNGFLLAVLAIFIIALLVEFYPPAGWGLAILAAMALIGSYYSQIPLSKLI